MPDTTDVESGIAVVRSAYDAINSGSPAAAAALLHPDIVIEQSDALPWGGSYRGLAGFRDFSLAVAGRIDSTVTTEEMYESGDRVIQVGRTRGTVRASGRPFDSREVHVWRIREGRIAGLEVYVENDVFLEALGLMPS